MKFLSHYKLQHNPINSPPFCSAILDTLTALIISPSELFIEIIHSASANICQLFRPGERAGNGKMKK